MPPVSTPPPCNAVTSVSVTPYRLKTASIPALARIYTAVPLNQDLTNELEGATIVEPDQKKPKQHDILHPYASLPPRQTTAPDPSTITHKKQLLYTSESQSWDPSYLPHILHDPASDSVPGSSVQTGRKKHACDTKKAHNSMPTLNQPCGRRNITVTRNYHGPQGSITETQDATYIPKAGLEEQQIALWLNCIASYLRAHYEPKASGSQLDGGPSSGQEGAWNACNTTGRQSRPPSCNALKTLTCV